MYSHRRLHPQAQADALSPVATESASGEPLGGPGQLLSQSHGAGESGGHSNNSHAHHSHGHGHGHGGIVWHHRPRASARTASARLGRLPRHRKLHLCSARELAEQLTLVDAEMLRRISPDELKNGAWMGKDKVCVCVCVGVGV